MTDQPEPKPEPEMKLLEDEPDPVVEKKGPKVDVNEAFSNARILSGAGDYNGAETQLRAVIQDKHVDVTSKFRAWKYRYEFAVASKNEEKAEKAKAQMKALAIEAFESSSPADASILIDGAMVSDQKAKDYLQAELEKLDGKGKPEHVGSIAASLGGIEETPIRERIIFLTIAINNFVECKSKKPIYEAAQNLRALIKPIEKAIFIKDPEQRNQAFDALQSDENEALKALAESLEAGVEKGKDADEARALPYKNFTNEQLVTFYAARALAYHLNGGKGARAKADEDVKKALKCAEKHTPPLEAEIIAKVKEIILASQMDGAPELDASDFAAAAAMAAAAPTVMREGTAPPKIKKGKGGKGLGRFLGLG